MNVFIVQNSKTGHIYGLYTKEYIALKKAAEANSYTKKGVAEVEMHMVDHDADDYE